MEHLPWRAFPDPTEPRSLFQPLWGGVAYGEDVGGPAGLPAVEVFERGADVVVRAEIAGVEPQDLDVRISDDVATIRGERRSERRDGAGGYYRSERRYGAFVRTVALPAPVDAARARARFRHGLLEVVAPRREDDARRGRRVDVEVE
jgi:HSP20 family protein